MKKIFIVAPGDTTTGRPELCHQLAHVLNQDVERAFVLYHPFDQRYQIPNPYRKYNVRPVTLRDVDPGSVVILPEVYAPLIKFFRKAEIYFWWLSVDNFFVSLGNTNVAKVLGLGLAAKIQFVALRRRVSKHLFQSEYAREFLESAHLEPADRLSDCLADEFVEAILKPNGQAREDLLVYNPAKGLNRTELILRELRESNGPLPDILPIEGMQPSQVRHVLERAKVYIDFGEHPGKDRIPREAAALGACIIVNRRGSAENSTDIPIAEEFKIDDRVAGFESVVVEKIRMLMREFEQQRVRFDSYRQAIRMESASFLDDVHTIFPADL
jgi:hypothetical protein